jgi:hypothetical protein
MSESKWEYTGAVTARPQTSVVLATQGEPHHLTMGVVNNVYARDGIGMGGRTWMWSVTLVGWLVVSVVQLPDNCFVDRPACELVQVI